MEHGCFSVLLHSTVQQNESATPCFLKIPFFPLLLRHDFLQFSSCLPDCTLSARCLSLCSSCKSFLFTPSFWAYYSLMTFVIAMMSRVNTQLTLWPRPLLWGEGLIYPVSCYHQLHLHVSNSHWRKHFQNWVELLLRFALLCFPLVNGVTVWPRQKPALTPHHSCSLTRPWTPNPPLL